VVDTACNEASGQCEACTHECEAGFTRCQGADVETCLAVGGSCTRWDITLNCPADGRTCFESAGGARCGEGPVLVGLVAGAAHTCGLDARGRAWCWGRGQEGQLGVDPEALSPVPVRVDTSQLSLPDKGFRQLAAGWRHTCGLLAGGQVVCWGDNDSNQLGDRSADARRTRPTLLVRTAADTPLPPIKQLAAGGDTTCGLSAAGEAWCWGRNGEGQLGAGELGQSDCTARSGAERVDMASLGWADATLVRVEVGTRHACALTASGRVACWGSHEFGQLGSTEGFSCGTGAANGSPAPVELLGSLTGVAVVDLAAGEDHTCALDDQGRVHCWGGNGAGQCGLASDTDPVAPPQALALGGVPAPARLAAGLVHTCLLGANGLVVCWGADELDFGTGGLLEGVHAGLLGNGPAGGGHVPAGILLTSDSQRWPLKALAAGIAHTCALDARGRVFCWGSDRHGQLGDGDATSADAQSPVAVSLSPEAEPVRALIALAPGGDHTCGLTAAGRALCWGVGSAGQLGLGAERDDKLSPQAIVVADIAQEADRALVALVAGGLFTCALSGSGRATCFGANDKGQLGTGSAGGNQDQAGAPLQGDGWLGLAAGFDHACGSKQSGLAFCWGSNDRGQAGQLPAPSLAAPVEVPAAGIRWRGLSAGLTHTCGLAVGGQVLCWGNQEFGRLGNGVSAMGTALPGALVLGAQTPAGAWLQVAAGGEHTCGLTAAGEVWCWGYDLHGQLGDDALIHDQPSPVRVDFSGVDPPEARAMVQIAAGGRSSCSLNAQGQVYCWGQINQETSAAQPVLVDPAPLGDGDEAFTLVLAGTRHVCGLTAGGQAYCWGSNDRGQGGTGDMENHDTPFPVSLDSL